MISLVFSEDTDTSGVPLHRTLPEAMLGGLQWDLPLYSNISAAGLLFPAAEARWINKRTLQVRA